MTKYIVFIFLLLFSCTGTIKQRNIDSIIEYPKAENKIKLRPIDTITLKLDSTISNLHYNMQIHDTDTSVLYMYNTADNYFVVHNVLKNNIILKKKIEDEGPEKIIFDNYYYHNNDSIFIISEYPIEITLVNIHLDIKKRLKINTTLPDGQINKAIFSCGASWFFPTHYDFDKNSIYLKWESGENPLLSDSFYYHTIEAAFDLSELKFQYSFGEYPSIYLQEDVYFPDNKSNPSRATNKNIAVYSFPVSDNLYIYNNQTGKHLRTINAKSKYVDKFNHLDNKALETQQLMDYIITEPGYNCIKYDKYNNLYYRIVKHRQSLIKQNGKTNAEIEAEWSVIILDENFNIKGEHKFEASQYWYPNFHPIKGGILIGTNNKFNAYYTENQIQYVHYKISSF